MSLNSQFSLALELSNIFPIRAVVDSAATQFLKLARDLRRSGSDIVVEADLAAVFGRGVISSMLEDKFRNAVKLQTFVPLTREGEIRLDSGPGPTMHRAFRERSYFATVVQLSLLAWMQPREQLAMMLSSCMTKRVRLGIEGASDPGYESIFNTLAACSSQSSNFAWSFYVQQVEAMLRSSFPEYKFHHDYIRMSDTLLSGAMDYLYLVQSLPEQRKILVSNQLGCVTLVVWAHYALGLTVAITHRTLPDNNIIFGDRGEPQVIITWQDCRDHTDDPNHNYRIMCKGPQPEILLLDQDMSVVLRSFPDEPRSHTGMRGMVHDRHALLGYGTTFLHRLFNTKYITIDNDPIYEDSVKLITALAIHASSRLDRKFDSGCRGDDQFKNLPRYEIQLEVWRVLSSSKIIFGGTKHDPAGIASYVEFFSNSVLSNENLPASFSSTFKKARPPTASLLEGLHLIDQIQFLARVVLLFAFVVDVEGCAEMPIFLDDSLLSMRLEMKRVCSRLNTRVAVAPETVFYGILQLLSDDTKLTRASCHDLHEESEFLFLCSDFGWSVFLDTIGDKDPANVKPHLVHVQKGVPTNSRTNERKLRISDGGVFVTTLPRIFHKPPVQKIAYTPRAVAQVTRRDEYWTSKIRQFELTIRFMVEISSERALQKFDLQTSPTEHWVTCRSMHRQIWETFLTPPCEHEAEISPQTPLNLGPDALAIVGWSNQAESTGDGPYPQRIVIFLTRGDARLRWLAVQNATEGGGAPELEDKRETALRTADCCEKCALEHISSFPGRWTLIL
ncbi:hypothetical protein EPUS_04833 [Endocarpon pusillum Z07020]|uniref:Uncharacterized protein n=1 Tax=Endocarpon pusillum (strain Z07020 / HMAS-L-300199) TaxID=1263415 RepID=U1GSS4_ENDPU|nr:uncharacterized protein EPUS_04833 [Endocarpon pusillum Z07020]ERF75051.1 hypothetical protein EPUS_04833 [Endocarpon pusillum Z07020]